MPELPAARRARVVAEYALPEYDAQQLTQSRAVADQFEATVRAGAPAKAASNWTMQTGTALAPSAMAGLIALVEQGAISRSVARGVFDKMVATGQSADAIVAADGLTQISDDAAIATLVAEVVAKNADAVALYRGGKTATFGFLVGQVMKAAGGKGNPKRINELLKQALET
jgi:aspartyl-tRNA(Asn)/glutamyl-tRNA(Gln) amidotransferase subunit B